MSLLAEVQIDMESKVEGTQYETLLKEVLYHIFGLMYGKMKKSLYKR